MCEVLTPPLALRDVEGKKARVSIVSYQEGWRVLGGTGSEGGLSRHHCELPQDTGISQSSLGQSEWPRTQRTTLPRSHGEYLHFHAGIPAPVSRPPGISPFISPHDPPTTQRHLPYTHHPPAPGSGRPRRGLSLQHTGAGGGRVSGLIPEPVRPRAGSQVWYSSSHSSSPCLAHAFCWRPGGRVLTASQEQQPQCLRSAQSPAWDQDPHLSGPRSPPTATGSRPEDRGSRRQSTLTWVRGLGRQGRPRPPPYTQVQMVGWEPGRGLGLAAQASRGLAPPGSP